MTATELSALLAARAEQVCQHLLPGGRSTGGNWVIGGTDGERGKSLHVQLTGSKAGVWLDFSTGEKGDMLGLWRAVRGINLKDAYREAAQYLDIPIEDDETPAQPSKTWLQIQREMGTGTEHDIATLATLRKLPFTDGLRACIDQGTLFFGPVFDEDQSHASWILTDSARRGAQARRMDGGLWANGMKAKTIAGTTSKWPVGIAEAGTLDIAFVEGGPDFLAAATALAMLGMTDQIQPVAMFGSSNPIHRDALPLFARKTVWMFPHDDENLAGLQGAVKWDNALRGVNAVVIPFDFTPYPGVKDLNDFVSALAPVQSVPTMEID